ncbi:MAG: type VI-A CRISPR-associated RNA-guided ribonuclease Cas13a [Clostridia bacterium]|nr:type VI-A CRISPR-associated RNA-guided ribonuclease Cas13a [Clostridia bacterium]
MKISKLNSIRFANNEKIGFLYETNIKNSKPLESHIINRIEEVKGNFEMFSFILKNYKERGLKLNEFNLKVKNYIKDKSTQIKCCFYEKDTSKKINMIKSFIDELNRIIPVKNQEISDDFFQDIVYSYREYFKKALEPKFLKFNINKPLDVFSFLFKIYKIYDRTIFKTAILKGIGNNTTSFNKDLLSTLENLANSDYKSIVYDKSKVFLINFKKYVLKDNENIEWIYTKNEALKYTKIKKDTYIENLTLRFLKEEIINYIKLKAKDRNEKKEIFFENIKANIVCDRLIKLTQGRLKNYFTNSLIRYGKLCFIKDKNKTNEITSKELEFQKAEDELRQHFYQAVCFAEKSANRLDNSDVNSNYFFRSLNFHNIKLTEYVERFRNNTFHFIPGAKIIDFDNTEEKDREIVEQLKPFIEEELKEYPEVIKEKITALDMTSYFNKEQIENFFNNIYLGNAKISQFFPSFKNINKYLLIDNYYAKEEGLDSFKNLQVFIYKTIYNKYFVKEFELKPFSEATLKYVKNLDNGSYIKEFDSLNEISLKKDKMAEIANRLLVQFNLNNTDTTSKNIDKIKSSHFKIILNQLVAQEFLLFLNKNFASYLDISLNEFKNIIKLEKSENIDNIKINFNARNIDYSYFLFALLLPNSIANDLMQSLKKYIQFSNDIDKRYSLNNSIEKNLDNIYNQIKTLELAIDYSNSTNTEDDDIKEILKIAVNDESIKSSKDEKVKNFYVLIDKKNEEHFINRYSYKNLKKFGTYDVIKKLFENNEEFKIKEQNIKYYLNFKSEDLENYYNLINKKEIEKRDIFNVKNAWEKVNDYIAIKNMVTLQNIINISNLIIDLSSHLVSYAFKWERDSYYFLLGYVNLKYKNDEELKKNKIEELKTVFSYEKENKAINEKLRELLTTESGKLYNEIFKIKTNTTNPLKMMQVRNDIDHFVYLNESSNAKSGKNLFQIYCNCMFVLTSYNSKLKESVLRKFTNVLEKYGIFLNGNNSKFIIDFNMNNYKIEVDDKKFEHKNINNDFQSVIKERILKKEIKYKNNKSFRANNISSKYAKMVIKLLNM